MGSSGLSTVWAKAKCDFSGTNPQEMAAWSGASLLRSPDRLQFSFCGHLCQVFYPQGEVIWAAPERLHENEEVLILQYVAQATGLPLRGRWLSFLELPGGEHHDALFRKEAHLPLVQSFGDNPDGFIEAAQDWGGRIMKGYGDVACMIPVFPRLPVLAILWQQDEEFSARSALLFDSSAPGYLSTAALYVLGIALAQRLVQSRS